MFCRQAAMELSALRPLLQAHGIRLVGIGFAELGLLDFITGEYFSGELFLDKNRESYRALGYRKFNICTLIGSLFTKTSRQAFLRGHAAKIKKDLKGDGFQNGGLLIVKKGGQEVLLSYRQINVAEHVENSAVVKALGLDEDAEQQDPDSQTQHSLK